MCVLSCIRTNPTGRTLRDWCVRLLFEVLAAMAARSSCRTLARLLPQCRSVLPTLFTSKRLSPIRSVRQRSLH